MLVLFDAVSVLLEQASISFSTSDVGPRRYVNTTVTN